MSPIAIPDKVYVHASGTTTSSMVMLTFPIDMVTLPTAVATFPMVMTAFSQGRGGIHYGLKLAFIP